MARYLAKHGDSLTPLATSRQNCQIAEPVD
jgi:hypothetical protein